MADPIGETPGQRLPPLITYVPAVEAPPAGRRLVFLGLALVLLGAMALAPGRSPGLTPWFQAAGGLLMLAGIAVALVAWAKAARAARVARARWVKRAESPDWRTDPLAQAMRARWQRPDRPPNVDSVRSVICLARAPNPPRARIICLGEVDVPEGGALRFEPLIITPTRFVGQRLWAIAIALGAIVLWAAQQTNLLPSSGWAAYLRFFTYLLLPGAIAAVAWIWRTTIRPTYVRLAPGIVQIVRFPFGKGKPDIRSYPMDPEAVIVVLQPPGAAMPRTITLLRGGRHDELPLHQMSGRAELMERFWQALLTTAPTPPLSDEDLLG